MRKLLTTLAAAVVFATTAAPLPVAAKDLVIGRPVSTTAMDPGFLREAATIVDNIFDTLVMRDVSMKLVPGLALSWMPVGDTTWEFKLRPDVKFHNGESLNAEAVKFTIDRILDPDAKSPTISYIRTIKSVEIVDDMTIRVITNGPDPLLPTRMSRYPTYIVPPKYVKEVGKGAFASKPIGTGPYKLVEFVPDQHVLLEANADYWRGKPEIDRVVWRPIPDSTARVTALLTDEVQMIEGVPADLARLVSENQETDLVKVANGGLTIYLGLKSKEAPLDNLKVRQALNMAIDRRSIVENVLRGLGTTKGTQVGPYDFGYVDIPVPEYAPEKAKALLVEAGYPDGFEIHMQATRRYVNGADVGQAIAQQLGQIGVKVNLDVPEWSVYIQQVPASKQAPIYMLGWGSTQTLDADAAIYAIFRSGEPYSTVSNSELDNLLDESRKTVDSIKRAAILKKIQEVAAVEVPVLTLYQEDALYGKRKGIEFYGRADARIPVFNIRLK